MIAEIHQSRNRIKIKGIPRIFAGRRWLPRLRHPLHLVFQFQTEPFRGFFANPGQLHEPANRFTADGGGKLGRRDAGQDGQGKPRTDAGYTDQQMKNRLFLFIRKTIEEQGIFPDMGIDMDQHLVAGFRKRVETAGRGKDLIADTAGHYDQPLRRLQKQLSPDTGDHDRFLSAALATAR